MVKAHIKRHRLVYNARPDVYYAIDFSQSFNTQFRPLQLIEGSDPQYIDPENDIDPNWDNSLYDQPKLQFKCEDYTSCDDEVDP